MKHFCNLKVNHKVLLSVQMHMSSNMLQSVENFNVQRTFLETMWDMYIFVHKYIIPSSEPFEILKTSLSTQIMLASQFVDFLEHTRC
jgi:hypothetical protein